VLAGPRGLSHRLVSGICHCQHSAELCDGDRHIQVMGPVLRNLAWCRLCRTVSLSGRIFDAEVVTTPRQLAGWPKAARAACPSQNAYPGSWLRLPKRIDNHGIDSDAARSHVLRPTRASFPRTSTSNAGYHDRICPIGVAHSHLGRVQQDKAKSCSNWDTWGSLHRRGICVVCFVDERKKKRIETAIAWLAIPSLS